ncbi:MAG: hypothetical protein ABSD12_20290, partial [Paraburkholderia sp.]
PRYCIAAGHKSYSDDRARDSQSVMPSGAAGSSPGLPAGFAGLRAKIVAGVRLAGRGKFTALETLRRQVLPAYRAALISGWAEATRRHASAGTEVIEKCAGAHYVGCRTKSKVSQL